MYDNGSMKIVRSSPLEIDVQALISLINSNVKDEAKRSALVQDVRLLASADSTTEESKIRSALKSVVKFGKTIGKDLMIKGISAIVVEVMKKGL